MGRKSTQKLFHLIKSLTPSELRFISINISKYEGKDSVNYILFHAIKESKKYDESELKNKILNYSSSPFPILKAQLYDKILSLLVDYTQNHSKKYQVKKLIIETEILLKKNFIVEAYKVILKAKKIAKEDDLHFLLLEILRLQIKRLLTNFSIDDAPEIESVFSEKRKILSLITSEIEINHNAVNHYLLFTQDESSDAAKKDFAQSIIQTYQHKDVPEGSFRSKIIFLYLLSESYFFLHQYEQALNTNIQQYNLFDSFYKEKHKSLFLPVLINLIIKQIKLKRFYQAQEFLNEFKTHSNTLNHKGEYLLLQMYINNYLSIFDKKLVNKAIHFIEENSSGLQQNYLYKIISCLLSSYYLNRQFKAASRILTKYPFNPEINSVRIRAMLIFCIILFESAGNNYLSEKYKKLFLQNAATNHTYLSEIEQQYVKAIQSRAESIKQTITIADTLNADDYFSLLCLYKKTT